MCVCIAGITFAVIEMSFIWLDLCRPQLYEMLRTQLIPRQKEIYLRESR